MNCPECGRPAVPYVVQVGFHLPVCQQGHWRGDLVSDEAEQLREDLTRTASDARWAALGYRRAATIGGTSRLPENDAVRVARILGETDGVDR